MMEKEKPQTTEITLSQQQFKGTNSAGIEPVFNFGIFSPESMMNEVGKFMKQGEQTPHDDILNQLIEQFGKVDFEALAFPDTDNSNETDKSKLREKHFLVLSIENVRNVAGKNNWGLCKNHDFIYLYNGSYWANIDKEAFQKFLGDAAERMEVPKFSAKLYLFREKLFKQFLSEAYLPAPEANKDLVCINLKNGTFEITPEGTKMRPFNSSDFMTYQLPFEYDKEAQAPQFQAYLDRVLPDKQRQMVLAEYLGFVFIKNGNSTIKEEKTLLLYGSGANGKSVFFEIVNALLGEENVSSYSLQSITNENGYYRAKLANKLVNYASEINGKLETSLFKAMVSGEPVEARLPYGEPFLLKQYAKLIFNCNELPKDVEHTNAFFRRFLIIPFDVTIPELEQDKQLHTKIIRNELSGVFNWVLEGLNRLLKQKGFSNCDAVNLALERYKTESDTVQLFINEKEYQFSPNGSKLIKDLYFEYQNFCNDDGFCPLNKSNFIKRLRGLGIRIEKKNIGNVAFI
jgi:putative DNA primase/helicase